MPENKFLLLDGCEVIDKTDKAVLVAWENNSGNTETKWIPRSLCEDGDTLDEGDKDLSVALWFVYGHDLPTGD